MKPRVTVVVIAIIFIGISSAIYIYNRHEKELTKANVVKVAQDSAAPVSINVVKNNNYNTINLSQQAANNTNGSNASNNSNNVGDSSNSNNQPNIVINKVN
ncbi:MAG: hypothetical protein ACRCX8_14545 [Sarcina sp.]